MTEPVLSIRDLRVSFPSATVVDGVGFDVMPGEIVGVVGESGSGKSTLGRLALRLIEPTSGSVRFDGQDLVSAGRGELRRLRRNMQIIFQDPFSALDPRLRRSST